MRNIYERTYGNVTVIEHTDYKWGVVDKTGKEIVPFGKYDWIDGFEKGLARVKVGHQTSNLKDNDNKWGIINEQGEEVLPVEYDSVWNFFEKNRLYTMVIKDKIGHKVYLHILNKKLPVSAVRHDDNEADDNEADDNDNGWTERPTYEQYNGSYAQDVEGWSDQVINDAFDGEPDAYWNID